MTEAAANPVSVSVVILTFGRDAILPQTLHALKRAIGARRDVEVILVDNNGDTIDRTPFLAGFDHVQLVRTGANTGVSARNDGMDVARGEIFVLLDDDVLVQTAGFLDLFEADFRAHPTVAAVNVRKLDSVSMTVLPETIPHTRKDLDLTQPFFTFRFVGGLVALRRQVHEQLGGFDRALFYGEEERDYSYRMLKAGWRMYYEPAIVALETNNAGGRRSRMSLRTEILANRYITSYLHRPLAVMVFDVAAFTLYLFALERGRLNVPHAVVRFLRWLFRPGRPARRPIGPEARAYIRACGGTLWR